jgi:glutamine synthetase
LDGLNNRIEPPALFRGDAYSTQELPGIPETLPEAIAEFESSHLFRQAFGDDVVEHLAHFARTEQRKFDETVTTWERRRFFERA